MNGGIAVIMIFKLVSYEVTYNLKLENYKNFHNIQQNQILVTLIL